MLIKELKTELRNPDTLNIDNVPTYEMLKMINNEDKKVAFCVEKELEHISKAVDAIAERYAKGGRVIYIGAGTSGRLGIIDSSECKPTFGIIDDEVIALIAGGRPAVFDASEGAEDDRNQGINDVQNIKLRKNDALIGIAASGRTPYVIGAIEYANQIGCLTVSITCNQNCVINDLVQFPIGIEVGAEAITGSTRLKAGTAQKMVLNMISTGIMIKTGKVFSNLMVNMIPSNEKLMDRGVRIIQEITQVDYETALQALTDNDNQVKQAIIVLLAKISSEDAKNSLIKYNGNMRELIKSMNISF